MTPKEKAEELVNKYRPMFYGKFSIPAKERAKKCALILCSEIYTNIRTTIPIMDTCEELVGNPDFWIDVQKEIRNL